MTRSHEPETRKPTGQMNALTGLNQDFEDILVELARADAEFIIVGAYALAFHGAPRATGDIDIWVRPTKDNATKVHGALLAFGAPLASAGLTIEDLHHAGTRVPDWGRAPTYRYHHADQRRRLR